MLDALQYQFIRNAIFSSFFGGVNCAIIGVFITLLGIPLLGVTIAHAAFAGAVLGILLGINPSLLALLFSLITSFFVGPVADKSRFNPEISLGIIFSFMLGLGFLLLGKIKVLKTQALSLIWGSILTVTNTQVVIMGILSLIIIILLAIFFKEIKAVIFNREIARSLGIPEKAIYYGILFLCGMVISIHLTSIGGLLIFSLIVNPAAAAYQLTYRLRNMFFLASLFGILASLLGLIIAYIFDLNVGATIIIISTIIFSLSWLFSPKR